MITLSQQSQWSQKPVDNKIFGCFIEAGFGRQLTGMWSEMLYNRAFRKVLPYQQATWDWLGVDEAHYNADAPFWHSGYEEFDWEPFGGAQCRHTIGSRTYKGMTSLEVSSQSGHGGLRQRGIHLQKGRQYKLCLFASLNGWLDSAGLNGFGDSTYADVYRPLQITIGKQQTSFEITTISACYEWIFKAVETEIADAIISFSFDGGVFLSWASLMPMDTIDGWRADVIEKMREAAPSVVRFPGGCYASFFDWRDTVGPREIREPQPSFYWGGLEENDVGVDEFMRLSELVGFEPQICFNMMTSDPFTARGLVEYLNAPADVGYGRYRVLNGHTKPYHVRLFEMDNEPSRKWPAHQYAKECVNFAREMRLADKRIEFMFAAYSYPLEALAEMLEIVGHDIQYVIYRHGDPVFVSKALKIIRSYNQKAGTSITLANTEWLPSFNSIEPFEMEGVPTDFQWRGLITNDYRTTISIQQRSWNYALNGAHRLLDYMTYGGDFAIANFNNMCNTWGQNLIESDKDTCFLSNMGEVFRFFKENFKPCIAQVLSSTDDRVFAVITRDGAGGLSLYIINHSSQALEVRLPQGGWATSEGIQGKGRITAMQQENTAVSPCRAAITDNQMNLPPLSIHCIKPHS